MGNYIGRLVLFVQKMGETVDHLWFNGCQKYWTYWLVGVTDFVNAHLGC